MAVFKAAAFTAILALIMTASSALSDGFSVIARHMSAIDGILRSMGGS